MHPWVLTAHTPGPSTLWRLAAYLSVSQSSWPLCMHCSHTGILSVPSQTGFFLVSACLFLLFLHPGRSFLALSVWLGQPPSPRPQLQWPSLTSPSCHPPTVTLGTFADPHGMCLLSIISSKGKSNSHLAHQNPAQCLVNRCSDVSQMDWEGSQSGGEGLGGRRSISRPVLAEGVRSHHHHTGFKQRGSGHQGAVVRGDWWVLSDSKIAIPSACCIVFLFFNWDIIVIDLSEVLSLLSQSCPSAKTLSPEFSVFHLKTALSRMTQKAVTSSPQWRALYRTAWSQGPHDPARDRSRTRCLHFARYRKSQETTTPPLKQEHAKWDA